jgi:hypothetical protein
MDSLQIFTLGKAVVQIKSQSLEWHFESARERLFYRQANHVGQSCDVSLEPLAQQLRIHKVLRKRVAAKASITMANTPSAKISSHKFSKPAPRNITPLETRRK